MIIELMKDNLKVEAEKHLTVYYDNQIVGDFYVDLFIENEIIVEIKSVKNLSKEHACPVECLPRAMLLAFYCTRAFLNLFNWGGPISQLPQWLKKGHRSSNQLWALWR